MKKTKTKATTMTNPSAAYTQALKQAYEDDQALERMQAQIKALRDGKRQTERTLREAESLMGEQAASMIGETVIKLAGGDWKGVDLGSLLEGLAQGVPRCTSPAGDLTAVQNYEKLRRTAESLGRGTTAAARDAGGADEGPERPDLA